MRVAMIHEVFLGPEGPRRLRRRLSEARDGGAELALLPELPLHSWVPATRGARDEDSEPSGGPIHENLAGAAADCGIGVMGGAIVRDAASGRRRNRALLFDREGRLVSWYDKVHIPLEEGFWEGDHYESGNEPPGLVDRFGLPFGMQICSDLQRPQGVFCLGARGAAAVFAPRATPPASYERWRRVIRTIAQLASVYVISVNRPAPESGVEIGGPSVVAAPDGELLAESVEPLAWVTLERGRVERARRDYPGYLGIHAELYARAWSEVRDSGAGNS